MPEITHHRDGSRHDSDFARACDRIGAPFGAQLFEQARSVGFDSVGRNLELGCDLLCGAAGGNFLQHLKFALADAQRCLGLGIAVERSRAPVAHRFQAYENTQRQECACDEEDIDVARIDASEALVVQPL